MAGEIKKLLLSDGVDVGAPSELGLVELEEGMWTPVLKEGANAFPNAGVSGCYVKMGKMVVAYFTVTNVVPGVATGVVSIEGLPYTASSGCSSWIGKTDFERWNFNVGSTTTYITTGQSIIQFVVRSETGGGSGAVTADLAAGANTSDMAGSITYLTD